MEFFLLLLVLRSNERSIIDVTRARGISRKKCFTKTNIDVLTACSTRRVVMFFSGCTITAPSRIINMNLDLSICRSFKYGKHCTKQTNCTDDMNANRSVYNTMGGQLIFYMDRKEIEC